MNEQSLPWPLAKPRLTPPLAAPAAFCSRSESRGGGYRTHRVSLHPLKDTASGDTSLGGLCWGPYVPKCPVSPAVHVPRWMDHPTARTNILVPRSWGSLTGGRCPSQQGRTAMEGASQAGLTENAALCTPIPLSLLWGHFCDECWQTPALPGAGLGRGTSSHPVLQ